MISLYFGRESTTFGKIGLLSPAYRIAPNYIAQVLNGGKKQFRVYEDFGTAEPADDWNNAQQMYDVHLAQGYAANSEITFVAGCGQAHNEAAWKERFPVMLHYLLPPQEEPNELAIAEYPPLLEIGALNLAGQSVHLLYRSLFGFSYSLERSSNLRSWTPVSTMFAEDLPWATRVIDDAQVGASSRMFWRLKATPGS